jgi:hypothetical protein
MRKLKIATLIALLAFISLFGPGNTQAGFVGGAQAKEALQINCDLKNAVLLSASSGGGLICLDGTGFSEIKAADLSAREFAVCPDGQLAYASFQGVSLFDGKKTSTLVKPPKTLGSKVACAGEDNIWAAAITADLYQFDGEKWNTFVLKELFPNDTTALLQALEIAPDGKTWVVTFNSVGIYDGKEWAVFDKKGDLKSIIGLSGGLAFDSKGTAWIGTSSGVLKYDGEKFTEIKQNGVNGRTLAVDSKDVLWVGTLSQGVFSFDGKKWTPYNRKGEALSSNRVNAIAIDSQDRVWVATNWGLNVFDGTEWKVFQAANSDLKENAVTSIAAFGTGPEKLPEAAAKEPGKVIGKVIQGRDPLKGAVIELCSEGAPIGVFTGKTPCGDYPDARSATTDENGEFEIDDVPAGCRKEVDNLLRVGRIHRCRTGRDIRSGNGDAQERIKFT